MKRLPWSLQTRNKPGFSPRRMPSPPPKKNRHPCRFGAFSFDVSVEHQLSSELERQTDSTRKDKQNAIHGHRQSHERLRKRRRTPRSPAHGRHEQIQRRAKKFSRKKTSALEWQPTQLRDSPTCTDVSKRPGDRHRLSRRLVLLVVIVLIRTYPVSSLLRHFGVRRLPVGRFA